MQEAMLPGMSVWFVASRAAVAPSQLFGWKRRMLEGGSEAVQADEDVVGPASCASSRSASVSWSGCSAARR